VKKEKTNKEQERQVKLENEVHIISHHNHVVPSNRTDKIEANGNLLSNFQYNVKLSGKSIPQVRCSDESN
jgi:hypothetical protein